MWLDNLFSLISAEKSVYQLFLSIAMAFSLTYLSIPVILKVTKLLDLKARPNGRSAHSKNIPHMGGIGLFIGISVSLLVCFPHEGTRLSVLIASLLILFFFGLKDDILLLSPAKKIIAQLCASLLFIFLCDIRIGSFFGLFGVNEIPYALSVLFTLLTFLTVVNAYNLIDGVDGLAGSLGALFGLVTGIWNVLVEQYFFAALSFSVFASLVAFLRYNFSGKKRIFMGDTGSLIIGFTIAAQLVHFIQFNESHYNEEGFVHNAPIVGFVLFCLPLFDTLRVFMFRIRKGKSPFRPDKNHVHHYLLAQGFNHKQVSFILLSIQGLVMASTLYWLDSIDIHQALLTLLFIYILFSWWVDIKEVRPIRKAILHKIARAFRKAS
ncbi:MAG: undecaprenyl/decaprenyl-phosphate alpha-N-acetylglucosaminyl 1-phosphate transferase [Cytophagales bacterium]|nr:undecaprenyl/decaprenyl-phosphate alpha-N-acetylglucosaminyl 1-phosphate transferase [Cytophagales bacterium]